MTKLFIDLETTGLPKTKGFNNWYHYTDLDKYEPSRIIEIGLIVTDDEGNKIKEYSSLVKPTGFTSLKPIITQLTGIVDEDINQRGLPIEEVFNVLNEYLVGVDTIIAYNIGFDMNVLLSELTRISDLVTINKINCIDHECAMELSKSVLNLDRYKKLCNLYTELFQKPSNQDHRALADTELCKDVYFELKRLE